MPLIPTHKYFFNAVTNHPHYQYRSRCHYLAKKHTEATHVIVFKLAVTRVHVRIAMPPS